MSASKLMLKWSDSSEKMIATSGIGEYKVIAFPMPAVSTCIGAGVCASEGICFATQGRYKMPNVIASRRHNHEMTQNIEGFKIALRNDLTILTKKFNVIRIHDSGDFFSQEYLNAWISIICEFENTQFYCYTKSFELDWSNLPRNLNVIQSFGSRYDSKINTAKPNARVFENEITCSDAGYVYSSDSDVNALEGKIVNIGLVYHGTRNLNDSMKLALNVIQ